jgi:hypothetical protein
MQIRTQRRGECAGEASSQPRGIPGLTLVAGAGFEPATSGFLSAVSGSHPASHPIRPQSLVSVKSQVRHAFGAPPNAPLTARKPRSATVPGTTTPEDRSPSPSTSRPLAALQAGRDLYPRRVPVLLDKHFIPTLGRRPLGKILPSEIQRWVTIASATEDGNGLSAASVRKYHTMLHSVFARALRDRVVTFQPLRPHRAPQGHQEEDPDAES